MNQADRIQPYDANPFYWQYRGKPVLLLGGSVEDNLFQILDLEAHLDLLQSVGGNYVRCTMSSRDEGDVWPFECDEQTGRYDLHRPGVAYWARFERFLALTAALDIFVQIELWDRFDFARAPWQLNPYNPRNNLNYTAAEANLLETIDTHPGERENAFFRSVPALENNTVLLPFQHAQVNRLLELVLPYGHVLFCMDNETNESPEWGAYWAHYLQTRAAEQGITLQLTEMWDAHDLRDPQHDATFENPARYAFVDISQNNHSDARAHWANMQAARQRVIDSGHIRPMNSVKIYGANSGRYGSTRDAQERFWRNIFGGLASSRFHRPLAGLGLSAIAQVHIKAMRLLVKAFDVFACAPHRELLGNCSWNEAYCLANPGTAYAVFFPDGGDVWLDVSAAEGKALALRWLDIRGGAWWSEAAPVQPDSEGRLRLTTPVEEGYWTALIFYGG